MQVESRDGRGEPFNQLVSRPENIPVVPWLGAGFLINSIYHHIA